jgi:hypothetical protein
VIPVSHRLLFFFEGEDSTLTMTNASDALLASLPDKREPTVTLFQLSKQEPSSAHSAAAWKAMNLLWPTGVPLNLGIAQILVKVNAWIKKQPRNIVEIESVSREVVARLLGRRK